MNRSTALTLLAVVLFGGTACAQQQDPTDPWDSKGTAVTPKQVASVYVPAPSSTSVQTYGSTSAAGTYQQLTPQQRAELKQTMAQTAQQIGQVTKDFKQFYSELQQAVKDSGIVEEVNKMNLGGATAGSASAAAAGFGATDIRVGDKDMTVTVDLPGVEKKALSVSLAEASSLRIRVSRNAADDPSEYRLAERYRGDFDKTVPLPYKAVGKKFSAQLKNGVLTVVIPKEKTAASDEVLIPIE